MTHGAGHQVQAHGFSTPGTTSGLLRRKRVEIRTLVPSTCSKRIGRKSHILKGMCRFTIATLPTICQIHTLPAAPFSSKTDVLFAI